MKILYILGLISLCGCFSPEELEDMRLAPHAARKGMTINEYKQYEDNIRAKVMRKRAYNLELNKHLQEQGYDIPFDYNHGYVPPDYVPFYQR